MKTQTMPGDAAASSSIPAALDELAAAATNCGVRLASCAALERIIVRTRNHVYDLIVLSGDTGEVMVRGGEFFPAFRRATVAGSFLVGGSVQLRAIRAGLRLELRAEGKSFVTSRIQSVCRCRLQAAEETA